MGAWNSVDPVDFFDLYLTIDLLEYVVEQTNKYAEFRIAQLSKADVPHSRVWRWVPTHLKELKSFIGLHFLAGIIRKARVSMYWSTKEACRLHISPAT